MATLTAFRSSISPNLAEASGRMDGSLKYSVKGLPKQSFKAHGVYAFGGRVMATDEVIKRLE